MVKAEKLRLGDFLTGDIVGEAITKAGKAIFKIETEADIEHIKTDDWQADRYQCEGILYMDAKKKETKKLTWTMNMTSSDFLIDKLGDETSKWIGEEIELETISQRTPAGKKDVVYPVGAVEEK